MLTEPLVPSREARARMTQRLFPQGLPRLWCPTLTHCAAKDEFDEPRNLDTFAWIGGFSSPPSTNP